MLWTAIGGVRRREAPYIPAMVAATDPLESIPGGAAHVRPDPFPAHPRRHRLDWRACRAVRGGAAWRAARAGARQAAALRSRVREDRHAGTAGAGRDRHIAGEAADSRRRRLVRFFQPRRPCGGHQAGVARADGGAGARCALARAAEVRRIAADRHGLAYRAGYCPVGTVRRGRRFLPDRLAVLGARIYPALAVRGSNRSPDVARRRMGEGCQAVTHHPGPGARMTPLHQSGNCG